MVAAKSVEFQIGSFSAELAPNESADAAGYVVNRNAGEMNEGERPRFVYRTNPDVSNEELNLLHEAAWAESRCRDFGPVLERSLAFVCAYDKEQLVGFVNVAWDGGEHAFLPDTMVHLDFQRRGIGRELVRHAVTSAAERGLTWMHVDFEPQLQEFYDQCGFKNTTAGLIRLGELGQT